MKPLTFLWLLLKTTEGDPPVDPPSDPSLLNADPPSDPSSDPPSDPPQDPPTENWFTGLAPELQESISGLDAEQVAARFNVPDEYVLPDGVDPEGERVKSFLETAKELGLNQEHFDKLLEFDSSNQPNIEEMAFDHVKKVHVQALEKKLSEIGNEKMNELVSGAKKAIDAIRTDEISAWLDTGPGNDPMFIEVMAQFSKVIGEDAIQLLQGGGGGSPSRVKPDYASGDTSVARRQYPHH